MKTLLMFFTLVSILFIITSCELGTDEPMQGDVYYINVGIDYENNGSSIKNVKDDLKGTVPDAKELHQALGSVIAKANRTGFGYKMIQEGPSAEDPLDDLYPSKTKIQSKLATLSTTVQEHDLTIFTYSGHGYEDTGHLVLAKPALGVAESLSPDELLSWMAAIPGKKLVILDSCFSGMFVEESPSSTNTILNNSIVKFFETYHSSDTYGKPDLFVLTASAHTDSYEMNFGTTDSPHNHGIFTYALLEALGWDHPHFSTLASVTTKDPPAAKNGRITVDGLFTYVKANQAIVSRLKLFSSWSAFQHPLTTGGPLDLVLFNL